jgi:hypothetical protein
MIVRLEKIGELDDAKHPNNFEVGYVTEGFCPSAPIVGHSFYVSNFRTSRVTEIIDENTFKTLNSIYKWKII